MDYMGTVLGWSHVVVSYPFWVSLMTWRHWEATLRTKLKLVGASDNSGVSPPGVYPELVFYPIRLLFGVLSNQTFN